jgi:hypothetical protein
MTTRIKLSAKWLLQDGVRSRNVHRIRLTASDKQDLISTSNDEEANRQQSSNGSPFHEALIMGSEDARRQKIPLLHQKRFLPHYSYVASRPLTTFP